jgi:hypothetical protein
MEKEIEARNDEDWQCLISFLPENWEQMAADTGALLRLRGFTDCGNLLRTLLIHLIDGASLRQTVVHAKQMGIAAVSDVALLKRLNASGEWFRLMACRMLECSVAENALTILPKGYDVQLVDATCISKPGSKGTDWRIHYGISLPSLQCQSAIVTDASVGETLCNFEVVPKRVFIGDRGYSNRPGIAHVAGQGGDVIIRMNIGNLPLNTRNGNKFCLLSRLRTLKTREVGEWDVEFSHGDHIVSGRVCAIKKSRVAAQLSRDKLLRQAAKKQKSPQADTLESAGYIFVFTTLKSKVISAAKVLELYRGRWQIELAFKRLKSLLELGSLPKKEYKGAKAWIYGKFFAAMLVETLVRNAESLSPWGYNIMEYE